MRSLLVVFLPVLLTACTTRGEEYICWNKDTRNRLDAVAKVGRMSGKIEGYTAVDHNNLTIEIDASNSADYACQSRAEAEAKQRELEELALASEEEEQKAEQERIRAAEALADSFLEASKGERPEAREKAPEEAITGF